MARNSGKAGGAVDRVTALLVKDQSGVERLIALPAEAVTIGRKVGCGIRLESPYVSRQHARIEQKAAGTVLVDLDSENGCFVNDRRVRTAVPLSAGDVIGIADVSIRCLAQLSVPPPTQRYERSLVRPAQMEGDEATRATGANETPPAAAAPPKSAAPQARAGKRAAAVLRVQARTHEVWLGPAPPEKHLSAQDFKLPAYLYVQMIPPIGYRLTP